METWHAVRCVNSMRRQDLPLPCPPRPKLTYRPSNTGDLISLKIVEREKERERERRAETSLEYVTYKNQDKKRKKDALVCEISETDLLHTIAYH